MNDSSFHDFDYDYDDWPDEDEYYEEEESHEPWWLIYSGD